MGASAWLRLSRALFCLLLLSACGEPIATPEPVYLRIVGSTAMAPLVAELATAFHETAPTIHVEVIGLGTSSGLRSLRGGKADAAMASWLFPEAAGWRTIAIARDGVAVIVHPENSVEELGFLQLRDLFAGRVTEWAIVGGQPGLREVQPVSREEGSGTRAAFETLVMDGERVTPAAIVAPSSQAVIEYVAGHRAAIGYVSVGYVSPAVKALRIEGEWPTSETITQGRYPLSYELWLVTAEPPSAPIQSFLNFALSPTGQQIVGQRYGRLGD